MTIVPAVFRSRIRPRKKNDFQLQDSAARKSKYDKKKGADTTRSFCFSEKTIDSRVSKKEKNVQDNLCKIAKVLAN